MSTIKFGPQTFGANDLNLGQFKHTRLFHNIDEGLFVIFYIYYLSKLKNQMPKLRF